MEMHFTGNVNEFWDDNRQLFAWKWSVWAEECNFQRWGEASSKRAAKRLIRRAAKDIKRQYEGRSERIEFKL